MQDEVTKSLRRLADLREKVAKLEDDRSRIDESIKSTRLEIARLASGLGLPVSVIADGSEASQVEALPRGAPFTDQVVVQLRRDAGRIYSLAALAEVFSEESRQKISSTLSSLVQMRRVERVGRGLWASRAEGQVIRLEDHSGFREWILYFDRLGTSLRLRRFLEAARVDQLGLDTFSEFHTWLYDHALQHIGQLDEDAHDAIQELFEAWANEVEKTYGGSAVQLEVEVGEQHPRFHLLSFYYPEPGDVLGLHDGRDVVVEYRRPFDGRQIGRKVSRPTVSVAATEKAWSRSAI